MAFLLKICWTRQPNGRSQIAPTNRNVTHRRGELCSPVFVVILVALDVIKEKSKSAKRRFALICSLYYPVDHLAAGEAGHHIFRADQADGIDGFLGIHGNMGGYHHIVKTQKRMLRGHGLTLHHIHGGAV